MKFYIVHLHQDTLFGSRTWRYASPEAHSGEMSLYTCILNNAQGYRARLDDRPCHALRSTQKRQISLLDKTAVPEFYHMKGPAIDRLIQALFSAVNQQLRLIVP
jgi:hypothetical protein